ncbi:MAG: GWxTD domain-containing protein [Calditrichae bacterium]|nr:GWxTD domain-containing protein [Calditrichia bacterium]
MKSQIFIIILLVIQFAWSQPGERGGSRDRRSLIPHGAIRLRPYPVIASTSEYKVYLLVEIIYDVMQFTLENDIYHAAIETEFIFKEEDSKEVFSKIWESQCQLPDYETTNRRNQFFLTYDSLMLPPGKYKITFRYQDLKGKQKSSMDLNFQLPEIGNIYAALPLFLNADTENELPILGNIPQPLATLTHVPLNKSLQIYLQTYIPGNSQAKAKITISPKDNSSELYSIDTLLQSVNNRISLILDPPILQWKEGGYIFKLNIKTENDSLIQQSPFDIIWFFKPRSLTSLEYAVRPLEMILPKDEYKKLNSGGKSERKEKFNTFWEEKDPTPETAFNELMYEFYTRVDSVDMIYGTKNRTYGWRTDPGKIIIMYGDPNEVDDQSLNPIQPYLRWTYFMPDRILIFTFEAIEGRKKYRLVNEEEKSRQ